MSELFPVNYEAKYQQLKAAVQEMRTAQKKYYKTPQGHPDKKSILISSKQSELKVDQLIA